MEGAGILWLVATVLGPVVLGAALIYGTLHYRKRRKESSTTTTGSGAGVHRH